MEYFSNAFDEQFTKIKHYQNYPEMLPWIGHKYSNTRVKTLLVGESHYLSKSSEYHHDPIAWYEGLIISDKDDCGWIKTRNIISNGIETKWKSASKTIYRNIEKALFESDMFGNIPDTAFSDVAFMNFYQRPAEITGKSIKVTKHDVVTSNDVFQGVVNIILPDIVIFTSSLAFKSAKKGGSLKYLEDNKIIYTRTPHPGMPWWNRVAKKYGNKSGKTHFVDFVNKQVRDISA